MNTAIAVRQRLKSKLISTITSMEFNIEFLQITCLACLFIGYRRPKSSLNRFSLGGIWMVAEGVWIGQL
jgi:hypothetical protein